MKGMELMKTEALGEFSDEVDFLMQEHQRFAKLLALLEAPP